MPCFARLSHHDAKYTKPWCCVNQPLILFCVGLVNSAVSSNGSGQGQPRASPRPKAPQPQGPPDKDARGFTLGRGRSMPLPPGAGHSAAPAPGASPPTDSVATSSLSVTSGQQGGSSAAANLGQQLLAQLQGQSALGIRPDPGVDLGRGLLQQLQQGMTPSPAFPQHTSPRASVTQTDAGRVLLAQVQKSPAKQKTDSWTDPPAQPAAPIASPAQPQQGFGSNASAMSFEALLRGAAASQQTQAQPLAQPEPPAANHSGASPFDQLLRAAASNHASSQSIAAAPRPGFGNRQQPRSEGAGVAVAEAFSDSDPGRLLLQQLQQGGLQAPALGPQQQRPPGFPGRQPQQSAVESHTRQDDAQAGKQLLQQLQRVTVSDGSGAVFRSPVGAVAGAPRPMPSAPPAPASVLQNASHATTGCIGASHNQVGPGTSGVCLSHRSNAASTSL